MQTGPWFAAGLATAVLVGCHSHAHPGGTGSAASRSAATSATRSATGKPGATTVEVRLTCDTGDAEVPCVFAPAEVTIPSGGTVRWVNDDATFHTVTSSDKPDVRVPNGDFDAVLDEPGETYRRTFAKAGTFPYYCQPHSEFMAGIVRVAER